MTTLYTLLKVSIACAARVKELRPLRLTSREMTTLMVTLRLLETVKKITTMPVVPLIVVSLPVFRKWLTMVTLTMSQSRVISTSSATG